MVRCGGSGRQGVGARELRPVGIESKYGEIAVICGLSRLSLTDWKTSFSVFWVANFCFNFKPQKKLTRFAGIHQDLGFRRDSRYHSTRIGSLKNVETRSTGMFRDSRKCHRKIMSEKNVSICRYLSKKSVRGESSVQNNLSTLI